MPPTASLSPIRDADFGPAQARHLLIRAGFGGGPAAIAAAHRVGLSAAVDQLVNYAGIPTHGIEPADLDPDVIREYTPEERQAFIAARRNGDQEAADRFRRDRVAAQAEDRRMHAGLQRWWLARMIDTPRPAEENLTLLWHGHFATRHRDIQDAFLMQQQNSFFREHANGSFADLAAGIVRDPAMIRFLNNDRNNRQRPNENLARELMELFTLGEGHYTEDDIKAGARALTGYHVRDNDFQLNRGAHDAGQKTILGQTDDFDGDGFVRLLLEQEACSRFVALKLYRHFVADVSDDWDHLDATTRRVVGAMAAQLRKENYAIGPVLTTLLQSRHFYDPQIVGKKIKSPVQVVVGVSRETGAPMRDDRGLVTALRAMGQDLFEPPSVAGWEGGRAWINTSTLFLRQNTCAYLISGVSPGRAFRKSGVDFDPSAVLAGFDDRSPAGVTNYLCDAMLGAHVPAERRAPLVRFMQERDKGVTNDSLIALLLLITAMPEYQLC